MKSPAGNYVGLLDWAVVAVEVVLVVVAGDGAQLLHDAGATPSAVAATVLVAKVFVVDAIIIATVVSK